VNRTSYSYRRVSTPSNVNSAGRAGKTVYTLPVGKRSRLAQLAAEEGTRGALDALVAEQAIDLRVDWDGDPANLGHFEVLVGASSWEKCELIDPSGPGIDVISLATALDGAMFRARFQRGPAHSDCTFGVKAVPIVWKQELPAELDASYVAVRGTDYEYAGGLQPDLIPWTYSVLVGGVHRLTLELSMEHHYEMWVRLQDPSDPNKWQVQDPIVRPVEGGGNPTNERDGEVTA
jgi:hypothetical protein